MTTQDLESEWESVFEDPPFSVEGGLAVLGEVLTPALWPYTPYVQSRRTPRVPAVHGYSALSLQFFNHLAEKATFRRCAECGTRFVRHIGGSSIRSPHTKGEIRYCSKLCTDKAGSREYRRKRRARELHDQGLSREQIAEKMNESSQDVSRWLEG